MKQPVRLLSGVLLALFFSLEKSAASERWVVLGGDIAETLSALKADIDLVARDDTVLYPEPLTALPSVGYLRQLSAESVLSVQPDHILANQHAGPKEVLEQLDAVGVTLDVVSAPAYASGHC